MAESTPAPNLLAVLRECQSALAMIIAPESIGNTSVQNAFAQAIAAEAKARAAIAALEPITKKQVAAIDKALAPEFEGVDWRTVESEVGSWSKELVQKIAMDIGKETVAYVEVMYPKAFKAAPSTFKLSLRNHIYNEIMAAIQVTDEGKIVARLKDRKKFRRRWTAQYRKIRQWAKP